MPQSPSLLALLTLSATLGLAAQARGHSLVTPTPTSDAPSVSVTELLAAEDDIAPSPIPVDAAAAAAIAKTSASPTVDSLEGFLSEARAVPVEAVVEDFASQPEESAPEIEARLAPVTPPETIVSVYDLSQQPESTDPAEMPDSEALPNEDAAEPTETEAPAAQEGEPETLEEEDPDADTLDTQETDSEGTQVLVAEVVVIGQDGDTLSAMLEDTVYDAVETRPGQTTTRSQLQQDINNIFATGFFANVRALPSDTPLGVRIEFVVEPNPVLSRVELEGSEVVPEDIVDEIFSPQYDEIINLLDFQDGILALNNWYQENGYVLAQVIASPEITEDGVVTLQVAEGVIEDIEIRFLTEDGVAEDEEGNPIRGKTREFIITREFETEPGDVFQQTQIQTDLQRAFALGIFDDINLSLNPGRKDPRKVTVTVNVIERSTGSVAAGAGFNFTGDIFGTLSYRQDNFGGNNQKLSAEAQLSTSDLLFDVSFTDPWIAGDPFGTSYTANAFARRSISLVFDGGDNEIDLPNGDEVRINRFGGGISFRRPFNNVWEASLGTRYQRVQTTDEDGEIFTEDEAGNPLSASGEGRDDLWTVQFGVVRDRRNDAFTPTRGSVLRLGTEQSIPLGKGNIFMNRLRGSYSYYIPVSFINFTEGPQALAFNIQGGTILGDLPPYEAFTLGGTNSVRGFDEGDLATGRSFLQASVEYRFPIFSFIGGALFVDAGTDLGTGDNVPGSPGPDRDKPGSGFGYGAGVRVQTPLGPIRIDFGVGDDGDSQLHFGIGERF